MKLNCKPGDLAVIVSGSPEQNIGRIIKVTELHPRCDFLGGPVWCFEGAHLWVAGVADRCLRPIRDPGDGAVDESLSWLPVPFPELERA